MGRELRGDCKGGKGETVGQEAKEWSTSMQRHQCVEPCSHCHKDRFVTMDLNQEQGGSLPRGMLCVHLVEGGLSPWRKMNKSVLTGRVQGVMVDATDVELAETKDAGNRGLCML